MSSTVIVMAEVMFLDCFICLLGCFLSCVNSYSKSNGLILTKSFMLGESDKIKYCLPLDVLPANVVSYQQMSFLLNKEKQLRNFQRKVKFKSVQFEGR